MIVDKMREGNTRTEEKNTRTLNEVNSFKPKVIKNGTNSNIQNRKIFHEFNRSSQNKNNVVLALSYSYEQHTKIITEIANTSDNSDVVLDSVP